MFERTSRSHFDVGLSFAHKLHGVHNDILGKDNFFVGLNNVEALLVQF